MFSCFIFFVDLGKHENIVGLEDLFVRDAADELYIGIVFLLHI